MTLAIYRETAMGAEATPREFHGDAEFSMSFYELLDTVLADLDYSVPEALSTLYLENAYPSPVETTTRALTPQQVEQLYQAFSSAAVDDKLVIAGISQQQSPRREPRVEELQDDASAQLVEEVVNVVLEDKDEQEAFKAEVSGIITDMAAEFAASPRAVQDSNGGGGGGADVVMEEVMNWGTEDNNTSQEAAAAAADISTLSLEAKESELDDVVEITSSSSSPLLKIEKRENDDDDDAEVTMNMHELFSRAMFGDWQKAAASDDGDEGAKTSSLEPMTKLHETRDIDVINRLDESYQHVAHQKPELYASYRLGDIVNQDPNEEDGTFSYPERHVANMRAHMEKTSSSSKSQQTMLSWAKLNANIQGSIEMFSRPITLSFGSLLKAVKVIVQRDSVRYVAPLTPNPYLRLVMPMPEDQARRAQSLIMVIYETKAQGPPVMEALSNLTDRDLALVREMLERVAFALRFDRPGETSAAVRGVVEPGDEETGYNLGKMVRAIKQIQERGGQDTAYARLRRQSVARRGKGTDVDVALADLVTQGTDSLTQGQVEQLVEFMRQGGGMVFRRLERIFEYWNSPPLQFMAPQLNGEGLARLISSISQ